MKPYFEIKQIAPSRKADIFIFGDITPYPWEELGEASAMSIVDKIRNIDADEIVVHIDSRGGSIAEGWAIYNVLKNHPAKVTTVGEGFVASAALYPFLAGEQRIAASVSAYYLHEGMTQAGGYAKDLEKAAEEIRKLTEIGIKAFTETTGTAEETIRELMANETWLTPEEAKNLNIATEIREDSGSGASQDFITALIQKMKQKPQKQKTVIEMMAEK